LSIGAFQPDRIKSHHGDASFRGAAGPDIIISTNGVFQKSLSPDNWYGLANGDLLQLEYLHINFGDGPETASVCIAAYVCIKY
jgi:hypothetical protein